NALPVRLMAPTINRCFYVRQQLGTVDNEERPAVDTDVSCIEECRSKATNVTDVVFSAVCLSHQHFAFISIPSPCPILVRPAEAEREVRGTGIEDLIKRSFQKPLAAEPIVVVAEP